MLSYGKTILEQYATKAIIDRFFKVNLSKVVKRSNWRHLMLFAKSMHFHTTISNKNSNNNKKNEEAKEFNECIFFKLCMVRSPDGTF